ncbi:MAG TPA: histidine phosphatase family protein [Bradyrhizobium sp.]|nr:histidine phosphatase family protein [Bradyrhizobium sp.]
MSKSKCLWLIRHAAVLGASDIIHDRDAPADVSNIAALSALHEKLPQGAAQFASPSSRTLQTAAALGLDPVPDANLLEQNFGDWTGRRHEDLARELGAAYHDFWKAPAENRPSNGESFADQVVRVRAALDALPSGDVIVVAHSGTIRAVLAIALGISPESALRFKIDPLSLTRIDHVELGWRVVCVNC